MKYIELLFITSIAIIPLFSNLKSDIKGIPFIKRLNFSGWLVIILTIAVLFFGWIRIHNDSVYENTIQENEIFSTIEISSLSKNKIDSINSFLPKTLFMRNSSIGNNDIKINYEKENVRSSGKGFDRYILTYSSNKVKLEDNYLIHSFEIDEISGKQLNFKLPEITDIDCVENIEIKFSINIRNKVFVKYINCNQIPSIKIEELK
ncbi:hypothetical protein [Flavobacterium sp. FlaQc-50]|jgi:alpha-N-acetylglucosamine transferase|uniref:hypothetical protein n=1 Tax=unclassified Flavobacterium TaxID=196869 RepID=UPI0037576C43